MQPIVAGRVIETYRDIETWSRVLIRGALLSFGLPCLAVIARLFDDRLIIGMPAFVKPAKFGAAGAIYLFTLAYMVRALPRSRVLTFATSAVSWILVTETVLIFAQAARGQASHFNINTPVDVAIFSLMGVGISIVWFMSAVLLVQHWRRPSADRAMALALRCGLALNILGAGTGWLMTQPRPAQLAAMKRGERPLVAGTHTIGASDGGLGLPLLGWSRAHGDLRVPHFLFVGALLQALAGQSVISLSLR